MTTLTVVRSTTPSRMTPGPGPPNSEGREDERGTSQPESTNLRDPRTSREGGRSTRRRRRLLPLFTFVRSPMGIRPSLPFSSPPSCLLPTLLPLSQRDCTSVLGSGTEPVVPSPTEFRNLHPPSPVYGKVSRPESRSRTALWNGLRPRTRREKKRIIPA